MKNHLKRIAAPRTWPLNRKERVFTTRPSPSGHPLESGLPLVIIIRDLLEIAHSAAEVKKMLHNNEVLVDGKRRKDHRFAVGLFDVVSFPAVNKSYRILFDKKGRFVLLEINDGSQKPCKVTGKKVLSKGKTQLNLHDGRNVISKEKVSVGDTVLLNLPDLKIKNVLPRKTGSTVYLTKGKHAGDTGQLVKIEGKEVIYSRDGKEIHTATEYLFVIGEKDSVIQVSEKKGNAEKKGKKAQKDAKNESGQTEEPQKKSEGKKK